MTFLSSGEKKEAGPQTGNKPTESSEPSSADKELNQSAEGKDGVAWGYDLYPERRGAQYKPKWSKVLVGIEGRENIDMIKCERNVVHCIKNSPIVKLMMNALKSSGW